MLAARGHHLNDPQMRPHRAQRLGAHVAALVPLDHNGIRAKLIQRRHGPPRPLHWRSAQAVIRQQVAAPIRTDADHHDAMLVAAGLVRHRRVHAHQDARHLWHVLPAIAVQHQAVPDGANGHGLQIAQPNVTVTARLVPLVVIPLSFQLGREERVGVVVCPDDCAIWGRAQTEEQVINRVAGATRVKAEPNFRPRRADGRTQKLQRSGG